MSQTEREQQHAFNAGFGAFGPGFLAARDSRPDWPNSRRDLPGSLDDVTRRLDPRKVLVRIVRTLDGTWKEMEIK